jgi:MFS transporter, APGE family, 1-arseno-3-phosphoglycerate exporter
LFLFYEFFGVVTNLVGGWLGARFGLKSTLFAGLTLQVLSLSLLAVFSASLTMPLVMVAQALSGIAKDLTKMSSKSFIKFVVPADQSGRLMRWVALLTGSKNALKGLGFFLGGLLLQTVGFAASCYWMGGALIVAIAASVVLLPTAVGKSGEAGFTSVFSQTRAINWLSASRFFLFGSRDIWFVLALPIFLATSLSWSPAEVGGFLALWVIGYGIVQAAAPSYIRADHDLWPWTCALILPLVAILVALHNQASIEWTMMIGLGVFGIVFASNSALHSYLIIAHADSEKVAMNVGFYYMANSAGRLVGTILSGTLFQLAGEGQTGLQMCLCGSIVFVILSTLLALPLRGTTSDQRDV